MCACMIFIFCSISIWTIVTSSAVNEISYELYAVKYLNLQSCSALLNTTWWLKSTNTSPNTLFLLLETHFYSPSTASLVRLSSRLPFLSLWLLFCHSNSHGSTCFSSRLVLSFCVCFFPESGPQPKGPLLWAVLQVTGRSVERQHLASSINPEKWLSPLSQTSLLMAFKGHCDLFKVQSTEPKSVLTAQENVSVGCCQLETVFVALEWKWKVTVT